jgi:hypothetical protein
MNNVGSVSYSWDDKKVNEEILQKAMIGVNKLSEIILGEAKKIAGKNDSPVTNTEFLQGSGFIRNSPDTPNTLEIVFNAPYARKQHEGGVTNFGRGLPFIQTGIQKGSGLVFVGISNPDRQKWLNMFPDNPIIWIKRITTKPKKFLEKPFNLLKGELKSFIERELK